MMQLLSVFTSRCFGGFVCLLFVVPGHTCLVHFGPQHIVLVKCLPDSLLQKGEERFL